MQRTTAIAALLALCGAAPAGVQFFPATEFELSGSEPRRVVIARLDEDAHPDVIVSMSADGEVALRFGDGSGAFPEDGSVQTGISAWALGVADFDGNGLDDFAVGDGVGSSSIVKVYRNDGGGDFVPVQTLSAGAFPVAMVTDDLDGDGDADLAVAANQGHGLSIFLNDGTGTLVFDAHVPGLASTTSIDLASGDLDEDGDVDLALAHYGGVHVCLNDGSGTFTVAGSAGVGTGTTHAVDVGDVDGDGHLDVASCQVYSGSITVRRGVGDGTFGTPTALSIGASADDVIIVDVTGEGRGDIVGVNESAGLVSIFESLGGDMYGTAVSFAVGTQPTAVDAGDLDHDGDPDLAVPNRNLGETPWLSVLLNDPVAPLCIEVIDEPDAAVSRWAGHTAAFEVLAVGEPPVTYAWSRDGQPLTDGTTPDGSIVSGTDGPTLVVGRLGPGDAGAFTLTITSPCGSTQAGPYALDVQVPPALPPSFTVTSLHPAGALASAATAIDEAGQYGSITLFNAEIGINVSHPGLWSGTAGSFVSLTPPGSAGGTVLAAAGGVQVGWWWWPYGCGTGLTCYSKQAASWAGSAATHDNLQVSGWEYSQANATDGVFHVGTKSDDDASGNTYAHAVMWAPPTYSTIDLHPPSTIASKSFGSAIDGDRQYGSYNTPFPGPTTRAARWSGSAASFVDMHPPGASASSITCAGDGQQGGTATFAGERRNGIWAESPLTFLDLAPGCGTGCTIADCASGLQVGSWLGHAWLWASDPDLAVDLHAFVPARFTSSLARAIHVDPGGTIRIVGTGYDPVAERSEALMWTSSLALPCPGDTDGNGAVDIDDIVNVVLDFGTDGGARGGDVDGSGLVDIDDIVLVVLNFGACPAA